MNDRHGTPGIQRVSEETREERATLRPADKGMR